ncbi:MAG: hypothetical protein K2Q24_01600 [Chitinophagaceae bacterium]|nr:hypothetical protein [Chitinophagaceae bacterium]
MRTFILTLLVLSLVAESRAQARIPVNEPSGNVKPNNAPVTNTGNSNTGSNSSSELKKYSDPQGRFTIGYPGDWKFEDKTENAVIQITSPAENDNDKFRQYLNLQIETLSGGTNIEEYVKTNMDGVKDLVKGYREVSSMYFNRNGAKAYQIIYKGKYGDMTYDIQIKQLFAIANGKGYVLTYISKEDERDAFETTANKIFNTFKY